MGKAKQTRKFAAVTRIINPNDQRLKINEKSKDINGIIITSSLPNIFSAGLDLMELNNPREDRLRQFWSSLQGKFCLKYDCLKYLSN